MTPPDELAVLRAEFEGWNLWPSDSGHLYATRRGRPLPIEAGKWRVFRTVHAPDAEGLRAELLDQAGHQERAELILGAFE